MPSRSSERFKTSFLLILLDGTLLRWVGKKTMFCAYLATCHFLLFYHIYGLQDLGAPNHGRPQRACCQSSFFQKQTDKTVTRNFDKERNK